MVICKASLKNQSAALRNNLGGIAAMRFSGDCS